MSDPVAQGAQTVDADMERVLADAAAAGNMLRHGREHAGVHVAALAVALKVPVHKLEALEAGQLGGFPDAVFVRALASSVCRTLKIDPVPVLALLPQNQVPRLSSHEGINASFKPGSTKLVSSSAAPGSRKAAFAVVLLLLAAVALVFVPRDWLDRLSSPSSSVVSTAVHSDSAGLSPQQDPASGPAVTGATVSESIALRPESTITSAGASVPVAAIASAAVASAPTESSSTAASANEETQALLVIRAKGESWVQVRSAGGATVLQRVLGSGESVSIPGAPPWSVVVGKADATEVQVRGKSMDLAAIARENVARFEVK
ncbi:helix-turn-helix domain-containing protein [Acidovorax sp. NCPPB 2350]|nr:helix-turn-helix domain-containing protein [Acidovorax sp. NCPPB 2350]